MSTMPERLVIFDFDNTLVDGNTDSLILDLLPELRELSRNYKADGKGWGEVMNSALAVLGQKGLQKKDVDECILALKITDTVKSMLLNLTRDNKTDVIIISHSNEYFINAILLDSGIQKSYFKSIYTYPAEWDEKGQLKVKRFHQEAIKCKYCPNDFCKGYFLANYIANVEEDENKTYSMKIYVGDGKADYCASTCLNRVDVVLCRYGFTLHNLILKRRKSIDTPACDDAFPKYVCWQNFDEMKEQLNRTMSDSI